MVASGYFTQMSPLTEYIHCCFSSSDNNSLNFPDLFFPLELLILYCIINFPLLLFVPPTPQEWKLHLDRFMFLPLFFYYLEYFLT